MKIKLFKNICVWYENFSACQQSCFKEKFTWTIVRYFLRFQMVNNWYVFKHFGYPNKYNICTIIRLYNVFHHTFSNQLYILHAPIVLIALFLKYKFISPLYFIGKSPTVITNINEETFPTLRSLGDDNLHFPVTVHFWLLKKMWLKAQAWVQLLSVNIWKK